MEKLRKKSKKKPEVDTNPKAKNDLKSIVERIKFGSERPPSPQKQENKKSPPRARVPASSPRGSPAGALQSVGGRLRSSQASAAVTPSAITPPSVPMTAKPKSRAKNPFNAFVPINPRPEYLLCPPIPFPFASPPNPCCGSVLSCHVCQGFMCAYSVLVFFAGFCGLQPLGSIKCREAHRAPRVRPVSYTHLTLPTKA